MRCVSRGSAVGIATGYALDEREVGVRVLIGARFSPLHVVQTSSGAYPASYPMGTNGRVVKLNTNTRYEVKNTWIYTSTPSYAFIN
jgi:hypothetical protein